jgi:hypothetical protein
MGYADNDVEGVARLAAFQGEACEPRLAGEPQSAERGSMERR